MRGRPRGIAMDMHTCPFCQHGNPADSKYCSECGGCLYLLPCASCGAINDVKAVACYQCHAQLQAAGTGHGDPLAPAAPVAVVTTPRETDILTRALEVGSLEPAVAAAPLGSKAPPIWRRHGYGRVIAGTAVVAGIAAMGYYSYRYQMPNSASQATAAGGQPHAARVAPASSGTIRSDPAPGGVGSGKAAAAAAPAASAAISAVNVRSDNAGAAAPRSDACSDASAALGLCAPAPGDAGVPAVTHTLKKE